MSRYLLALIFMTAPLQAATLSVCPATVEAPARALIGDAPGCRKIALGIDAARIVAVYPLPPDARPEQTILLQGEDSKGALVVSEHTLVPAKPQPVDLGLGLARPVRSG